jgi:hypothetical protein
MVPPLLSGPEKCELPGLVFVTGNQRLILPEACPILRTPLFLAVGAGLRGRTQTASILPERVRKIAAPSRFPEPDDIRPTLSV